LLINKNILLGLILLLSLAGGGLGYFYGYSIANSKAQYDVKEYSDALELKVVALLNRFRLIPKVVKFQKGFIQSLRQSDANNIQRTNLELERIANQSGLAAAYIMDLQGNTLAASNWSQASSFVGKNYGIRPYFQQAKAGVTGHYVAIGITSRKLGYYIAEPIYDGNQQIGVFVVKIALSKLFKDMNSRIEVALFDNDGIAFLSSHQEWLYRPLKVLSAETLDRVHQARKYDGSDFSLLPIHLTGEINSVYRQVSIGNNSPKEYLAHRIKLAEPGWTLETYLPMENYRGGIYLYSILGTLIALCVSLLLYIIYVRESHRAQKLAAAFRDPLTSVFTRLYMNESIPALLAVHERDPETGLSLLVLDIDHFKGINDQHGHVIGDDILRYIGEHLLSHVRISDITIRYGGDEFMIFMPGIHLEDAQMLAERIRQSITPQKGLSVDDNVVNVTLSIGVAEHTPGETIQEFIRRTDKQLYKAKENGRDQVCANCK